MALGFGDSQHLREDPDLEGLRKDQRFEAILRRAQTLEAEQAKGNYDKPAEIKGVKTVERQPEGGLRYHLRHAAGGVEGQAGPAGRLAAPLGRIGQPPGRIVGHASDCATATPCCCPIRSNGAAGAARNSSV